MGSIAKLRKKQIGILAVAMMTAASMPTAFALPTGEHENQKITADDRGVDHFLANRKNMSVELPFYNERCGQVALYGTYAVTLEADKVKMEPKMKVSPESYQPKNQYLESEEALETETGSVRFHITCNGSTLDIYPADEVAREFLLGYDDKNMEIESQALYEAFNQMGVNLEELDGVCTHFESMKVSSFRH